MFCTAAGYGATSALIAARSLTTYSAETNTAASCAVYSPSVPALSYKMRPDVPLVIVVEPTPSDSAAPAGVAHVPSPRQKVVADALVPLLRFVTGRLPVTPVDSGNPVAFVSVTALGVPRLGVIRAGLFDRTIEPAVPVTVYSPSVPALSYSTRPFEPPVTVVVPIFKLYNASRSTHCGALPLDDST